MKDQLPKLKPESLQNLRNAISLLGSAAGRLPFNLPDFRQISPAGQVHPPASLSASPVSKSDSTTRDTLPQNSAILSRSASLQSSLANRLQQRLSPDGLIFYSVKWKQKATPARRQYCQLVASKRHTNATDYFLARREAWPTTTANNATGAGTGGRAGGPNLQTAAQLVDWHTAIANDARGSDYSTSNGEKILKLGGQAKLSNWPTMTANDFKGSGPTVIRKDGKNRTFDRVDYATERGIAGPLILNDRGEDVTGSYALTETCGQLNPEHSRWLMGFPTEWCACAAMEMPSIPKSPPNSSAHLSRPAKIRIRAHTFEHDGWLALAAKQEK